MKEIKVVAAIIHDKEGKVFLAKRAYGFLKGKWEFPGGKVEEGETDEVALIREIQEELSTEIRPEKFYRNVRYDYPDFTLNRNCYLCHVVNGSLKENLSIHLDETFKPIKDLTKEDFCPADRIVAEKIENDGLN